MLQKQNHIQPGALGFSLYGMRHSRNLIFDFIFNINRFLFIKSKTFIHNVCGSKNSKVCSQTVEIIFQSQKPGFFEKSGFSSYVLFTLFEYRRKHPIRQAIVLIFLMIMRSVLHSIRRESGIGNVGSIRFHQAPRS